MSSGGAIDIGKISGGVELTDQFSAIVDKFTQQVTGIQTKHKQLSDTVEKEAARQQAAQQKTAAELAKIIESYQRTASALDPTTAATNRYEAAARSLGAAHAAGLISLEKHNHLLSEAKEQYLNSGHEATTLTSIIEKVTSASGLFGSASKEAAEHLAHSTEGVSAYAAKLSELGPIIAGIAAAIAVAAVGFEAFKFVTEYLVDAVEEGLKTQVIFNKLETALRANGSTAGYTSHEIIELSDHLAFLTGKTKEEVVAGETMLARFHSISHEALPEASKQALLLSKINGDVAGSFTLVGKALEGSTNSFRALQEIGVVLQPTQKKFLSDLIASGKEAEYQATVFALLKGHLGELADSYGNTLPRQIANAQHILSNFKEAIASEIIPALESITTTIVNSFGGWDKLNEKVVKAAHIIGNFVRTELFELAIWYQKNTGAQDLFFANMEDWLNKLINSILRFGEIILITESKLPSWLVGSGASEALAAFKKYEAESIKAGNEMAAADRKAAQEHAAAQKSLVTAFTEHKQALEGTDKLYPTHIDHVDKLAKSTNVATSALDVMHAALQAYADKIADLTRKQSAQISAQEFLTDALEHGIAAYTTAQIEQARSSAITSALTQVYSAHRAEIEKLTAEYTKLLEGKKTKETVAAAEEIKSAIDKENKSYTAQADEVGKTAGKIFDLKAANASSLATIRDVISYSNTLVTAQAKLTDSIAGNTDASRENAIQQETQVRFLAQLTPAIHANADAEQALHDKIENEVRTRHNQIDSIIDATTALAKFNALANQADFQTAVSRIDSSASSEFQKLEEKYLSFITDGGNKSVAQAKTFLEAIATATGTTVEQVISGIKSSLKAIQDAATTKSISDAGKSVSDLYLEERKNIERVVADGVGHVINIEENGKKKLEEIDNKFINSQLSSYSSAFSILSQEFGGVFTKILRFIQILQEIQTLKEDITSIIGGLTGLGSIFGGTATSTVANTSATVANTAALTANTAAVGTSSATSTGSSAAGGLGSAGGAGGAAGGLAVAAAIIAAYFVGSQILNIRDRHAFGSPGAYSVQNGQGIETGETAIAEAIKALVKNFETLAGVTVTSLDQIGIKVQNSGKEFRAYVGDTLVGTFTSLQEAVGVALQRAFSTATFSKAIDPAIAELISSNYSTDFTQLAANIKIVTDAINQNLPQVAVNLRKLNTDFNTSIAAGLTVFLTHASAGFKELFSLDLKAWVTGIENVRDSITGQTHSAFILFEQQRQAFNAENDAHRASLLAQVADTKAKLLAAGVTVAAIAQIMGAVTSAQTGLKAIAAASQVAGGLGNGGPGNAGLGGVGPGIEGYENPANRRPGGGGPGGTTGAGGPGAVSPTIPGIKEFNTDDLKALLAELVKELASLPDDIKSSEFSGNTASVQYFSNILKSTNVDFLRLATNLAASGKSATEFTSDLKTDLANYSLTLTDQRNAITGTTRSAKEELEIKKQQGVAFNAQLALDESNLQIAILKQKADILAGETARALAAASVQNAQAMGNAAVGLAGITAAVAGITDAQLEAMKQNLAALEGVLDALNKIKPIDPNEIKLPSSNKGGGSTQTPAQQLKAIFDAFDKAQLPQLAQQIADINKKWDDALKLAGKNSAAIQQINVDRAKEIALLEKQARDTAIANVNSFTSQGAPPITTQVTSIRTTAQGLVDGLRELNKEGALSTSQLHSLVAAIRAATIAQIDAIKRSVLESIDTFSNTLLNAGLTGTLAGIAKQAETLRDSLNQLAAAGTLTAQQFFDAAGKLITAAHAQEQAAFNDSANSLLSNLYGYLKDDKDAAELKYRLTVASLEIDRAKLALAVQMYQLDGGILAIIDPLIAKVIAAGPELFATGKPDTNFTDPATVLSLAAQQQADAAKLIADAAAAFKASTDKLVAYQQSLLTNSALSPLTPSQQLDAAKQQVQQTYAAGLSGNIDARNNFETIANTFLGLARSQNASNSSYGVAFQWIQDLLNNLIGSKNFQVPEAPNVVGSTQFTGAGGTNNSNSNIGNTGGGNNIGIGSNASRNAATDYTPIVSAVYEHARQNREDNGTISSRLSALNITVQAQQNQLSRVLSAIERIA